MKHKEDGLISAAELRKRAEEIAREKAAPSPKHAEALTSEESQRVLHDLQVHQIELEMQNEELRRAQVELEESRARYFDLYDLAPVGYCTISTNGLILEANLTAATLLGVSRDALVNHPIRRFVLKADQVRYDLHCKHIVENGEPQACELRMAKNDGTVFWVHMKASAAKDANGGSVWRVVLTDITERKVTEGSLERVHAEVENERLRLETVMDVLPTGVAITDALGGTIQTNTEFERIWAGPRPSTRSLDDYAVFKGWWIGTSEPVALEEWASAQAIREGKAVVGQMLEIQRFDGSRAFVINSASPVRDAAGNVIGSAIAIQDITSLRKAELRIQELNDALKKHVATVDAMNKELESYSHSVSHDLRTPLRFVNRIAHLLLYEPGAHLSNGAAQQVNMILQATGEMAKLIESLLVFSQMSREPMKKRRVDLKRLFQEAANELHHAQEDCCVEIVIEDLPPCQGDRTLLKEVVVNLLGNALKFTQRREQARITIGCTEAADETAYFIQDNGVGFDMSDADSLFVPFHRLHKPADFEGSGIGLALVKRIIERHGGRVWALGEIDKGATFFFTLGKETADNDESN